MYPVCRWPTRNKDHEAFELFPDSWPEEKKSIAILGYIRMNYKCVRGNIRIANTSQYILGRKKYLKYDLTLLSTL